MRTWIAGLLGGALLVVFSLPAWAQVDETALLMKKADKLYDQRGSGKGKEAKEAYEKVLAVAPESVEARWKLARTLYWLGTHTSSTDEQMKIFDEGIRYCQEAIKKDEGCIPCHFWLAVSYGKYGEAKGVMQSLGLVDPMKAALEKVKEKDPKYEWGGAYRVLGRLYFKLPGVAGGDMKKAIEYLRKAVEIGPKHLMNHRFLAEALLADGQKDEAQKLLKQIIDTPEADLLPQKKPEMKEEQEEAKKIWEKNWPKYW